MCLGGGFVDLGILGSLRQEVGEGSKGEEEPGKGGAGGDLKSSPSSVPGKENAAGWKRSKKYDIQRD